MLYGFLENKKGFYLHYKCFRSSYWFVSIFKNLYFWKIWKQQILCENYPDSELNASIGPLCVYMALMYDHHHVNMSLTWWHIMSLLTYCREVRAKQAIVCFSWNAIPVLHSCSAPLVFSFIRFYHCPTKKNQFRWKAKQEEPKKNEERASEKNDNDIFFRRPTSTQTSNPITPFWQWGIVGLKAGANLQQRVHCAPQRATWGPRGPRKDKGGLPTTDPERPLTPWPQRVNGGPAKSERESADVWKSPDGGFLGLARHR